MSRTKDKIIPAGGGVAPIARLKFPGVKTPVWIGEDNRRIDRLPLLRTLEKVTEKNAAGFRKLCAAFDKVQPGVGDALGIDAALKLIELADDPSVIGRDEKLAETFAFIYGASPDYTLTLLQALRKAQPKKSAKEQRALMFLRNNPTVKNSYAKTVPLEKVGPKELVDQAGVSEPTLKKMHNALVKINRQFGSDTKRAK